MAKLFWFKLAKFIFCVHTYIHLYEKLTELVACKLLLAHAGMSIWWLYYPTACLYQWVNICMCVHCLNDRACPQLMTKNRTTMVWNVHRKKQNVGVGVRVSIGGWSEEEATSEHTDIPTSKTTEWLKGGAIKWNLWMVEIEEMILMFAGDLAFAHKEYLHPNKVPIELEKRIMWTFDSLVHRHNLVHWLKKYILYLYSQSETYIQSKHQVIRLQ